MSGSPEHRACDAHSDCRLADRSVEHDDADVVDLAGDGKTLDVQCLTSGLARNLVMS